MFSAFFKERQPKRIPPRISIQVETQVETDEERYSHSSPVTVSSPLLRPPRLTSTTTRRSAARNTHMSLPRSNYDPRRVCLNPFPNVDLGKHRRTVGVYLAGALVRFFFIITPNDLFSDLFLSSRWQIGRSLTPLSSLRMPRPRGGIRQSPIHPCMSPLSIGFPASARSLATWSSISSTRIGSGVMKDLETRGQYGGPACSYSLDSHSWQGASLAVWCVLFFLLLDFISSFVLIIACIIIDCPCPQIHPERISRTVHVLRLRQRVAECCSHAFGHRSLVRSEYKQRIRV